MDYTDPVLAEIESKIIDHTFNTGLFSVMSANDWIQQAKERPAPKMLFDRLWYEGEICILFADTNLGKSILATQIADSISNGSSIEPFINESKLPQKVLYFDFELSDKQFEARYSHNFSDHYDFNDFFIRAEINPNSPMLDSSEDFDQIIAKSIENSIIEHECKIVIIDNLTYLRHETEKARNALPLMKELRYMRTNHDLSILILAHTPKRDLIKPLTRNDLQGSKMLINFCDSSFAVGESSQDKSIRYLKQIKSRNSEIIYDSDNVCICEIDKRENFLGFNFVKFGSEYDHLKIKSQDDSDNLKQSIIELKKRSPLLSDREIARKLETNPMKVGRVLKSACNTF